MLYMDANCSSSGNGCGSAAQQRQIIQFQFNNGVNWNNSPVILNSSAIVGETRGALQLDPDGNIYVARAYEPWLGIIRNSNSVGQGAIYVSEGIALAQGMQSREGLLNLS